MLLASLNILAIAALALAPSVVAAPVDALDKRVAGNEALDDSNYNM
jgi:hypothetical protein